MWSVGCTLYELYTGKRMFDGTNEIQVLASIVAEMGMPPPHIVSCPERLQKATKMVGAGTGDGDGDGEGTGTGTMARVRVRWRGCGYDGEGDGDGAF
jgi:hypothetical protein